MKKRQGPRLSAGEMEILQMLWRSGPVSLSEAQAGLDRQIGYTTMQTRLNRLVDKGVVSRSAERPARYSAAVDPAQVSAGQSEYTLRKIDSDHIVMNQSGTALNLQRCK